MLHLLLCVKLNPPFLGSGDLEEWQERVQLFCLVTGGYFSLSSLLKKVSGELDFVLNF